MRVGDEGEGGSRRVGGGGWRVRWEDFSSVTTVNDIHQSHINIYFCFRALAKGPLMGLWHSGCYKSNVWFHLLVGITCCFTVASSTATIDFLGRLESTLMNNLQPVHKGRIRKWNQEFVFFFFPSGSVGCSSCEWCRTNSERGIHANTINHA